MLLDNDPYYYQKPNVNGHSDITEDVVFTIRTQGKRFLFFFT